MRMIAGTLLTMLTLTAPSAAQQVQHSQPITPDQMKWQAAPPGLPPGAQITVLRGDPGAKGGEFVILIKAPAGYHVAAHRHATAENLTILSGSALYAAAPHPDRASATELPSGSYVYLPANGTHEVWAGDQGAVIEIHSVAPFEITYANPADDPRKQQAESPY